MRILSFLAMSLGVVALLVAIVGSVAGVCSYVLYEADLITSNTGANLILISLLCSLAALPIGFVGRRWAERRRQQPILAQSGAILGLGTLGAWIVVLVVALGK